jgi:ketosteroid isomerase-like protein
VAVASNVELLREILGKAVDDPDAFFARVDENVEWDLRDTTSPIAGLYRGRDAVRDLYRRWAGAFSEWRFDVERLIDAGDQVVAFVTEHGQGRGSGVEVEMKRANVTTFRDGMIVRWRSFSSRDDALRAAGLPPKI